MLMMEAESAFCVKSAALAKLGTASSNPRLPGVGGFAANKASTSSCGESNYFDSLLVGLREQANQIGKTRGIYVANRNASDLWSAKII
jgi:hypothetical protein